MDSSITSSLKPSKARHFPKAGAVPSVFSFRPHGSEVRQRSTKTWGKRYACLPLPSSGPNAEATHYRKLAESKGKRLQCRRSLCQEAFFVVVVSGCARGVHATQRICEITIERYLAFKKLGFLEQQTTVSSFFFLKYSFRRAMLQLEFRESKSKPEESHFEQSQRHRRYAAGVLWEVTMVDTYHLRNSAFLPFNCGLFFFQSTLWDEQCSNLSLDNRNPMKNTQNSPKRRQEKQRFARRKHWNHLQVTDRPRPDAPSLTQTIKRIYWPRNVSSSLSLCISISLLRLYTFFSRSHLVNKFSLKMRVSSNELCSYSSIAVEWCFQCNLLIPSSNSLKFWLCTHINSSLKENLS